MLIALIFSPISRNRLIRNVIKTFSCGFRCVYNTNIQSDPIDSNGINTNDTNSVYWCLVGLWLMLPFFSSSAVFFSPSTVISNIYTQLRYHDVITYHSNESCWDSNRICWSIARLYHHKSNVLYTHTHTHTRIMSMTAENLLKIGTVTLQLYRRNPSIESHCSWIDFSFSTHFSSLVFIESCIYVANKRAFPLENVD